METSYVAFDLELLDSPERGREILEIGAIRFRGDEELETYSVLVQTAAPLSQRIARLTGLTEADLAAARPPREALAGLERLIGSTPVVGQSVELDVEQVRRAGLPLRVPLLDTYELACLLLPGLPNYDLESVARALAVPIPTERHRALADARLAMQVFNALVDRVRRLDLETLSQIARLCEPLDWAPRGLFAEAHRRRLREIMVQGPAQAAALTTPTWLVDPGEATRSRDALVPNEQRRPLEPVELQRVLEAAGAAAAGPDGFEERPEQVEMLRTVARAFDHSETLLAEAGTGTGKSLAYLVPAACFALANNRRVVISTNTINLQDQLSKKELPALQQALGSGLRFTLLKGRSNYLCLKRWLTLLQTTELSAEERTLLVKTLLWLPVTRTGDRAELRLVGREEDAWAKLCALAEACSPRNCAYHRAGRCYLARARRAAEASHLVVVNHSLLLADLAANSRVLPEYRHLIVDEAHHLEDEATAQLGWRIGLRDLTAALDRLWESGAGRTGGLVPRVLGALHSRPGGIEPAALDRLRAELGSTVGDLGEALRGYYELLLHFVSRHGQRAESGGSSVRLSGAARAQPAWSELEIAWDDRNQRLLRLRRQLGDLARALERLEPTDDVELLDAELAVQVAFWDAAGDRLWSVLAEADPGTVAWVTAGRGEEVSINAAPLHVGEHLQIGLFQDKECVVLTSATMTAEGSFRYIRERLGVVEADELMVGSPFDYPSAALVYLPSDLPEPNAQGYQATVERLTGQLIAALEGRTLVLFTSYSQLRATYLALKESLEARQILLLGQRMDGSSRSRLLESFRGGERVALMGTTSFWEGVDVVGAALSCLVMARLPFTTPGDPVFQARSEAFEDPFTQYAVPQAILRFRQGFGRLIRSRSDRGAMVVLDRRLRSRGYGRAFLRSLPNCEVREGPASKAAATVRDWLEQPAAATLA